VQHTRPEPQTQQLEHPSVRDPLCDHPEQTLVIDLREVIADVAVDYKHRPARERRTDLLLGLHSRPARPEPERARKEFRLENRLQHEPRRLLADPVTNDRDAKRPPPPRRFGDPPPPHRRRPVAPLTKITRELREHP